MHDPPSAAVLPAAMPSTLLPLSFSRRMLTTLSASPLAPPPLTFLRALPQAAPDNFIDNKGFDNIVLRFDESRTRDYDTGSPTFGLQLLPPQVNSLASLSPAVVLWLFSGCSTVVLRLYL